MAVLRGDQEFAVKGAFRRTTVESFFRRKPREIGIVVFQRKMREDKIARARVKTFRIGKIFADGVIREMPGAAEDALLDDPRIRSDLEHVQIVIGFQQQTIGVAQMNFHQLRHVAKIGDQRHLRAIGAKREADRVGSVVRNLKGVDIDIANRRSAGRLEWFQLRANASPSRSGRARCSASMVCSVTYSGAFQRPSICGRPLQ